MHVMARQSSGVTDAVDSVERLDSGKVSTQQKHCLGVRERSLSMQCFSSVVVPNIHRPLCLSLSAHAQ